MDASIGTNAVTIAVAVIGVIVGVIKYLKTEAGKSEKPVTTDKGQVVAASFLDPNLVRDLVDSIKNQTEEYSRETRKMNRTRQELSQAMEESTDAVMSNTDAIINMVRFLRRSSTNEAIEHDPDRKNI